MNATTMDKDAEFDVIIVGAGFAGMYMLHRLRKEGRTARVYETGYTVGGTWYWNRYPGARCDAESLAYSFSFDEELEQEWEWTERYSTQPEILEYAEHVADRFDMRRDIRFERRVDSAHYDEDANRWRVTTEQGDSASAQFLIMATGCLSVPNLPDIEGLDDFKGKRYQASAWPHEPVSFEGQRVGIIGTGSSAIQAIPVIAEGAEHLTVFQRTPNYSIPAGNVPLDPEFVEAYKKNYPGHRHNYRTGLSNGFGDLNPEVSETVPYAETAAGLSDEEFNAVIEEKWNIGGAYILTAIGDTMSNEATNKRFADFVRNKIRETVKDAETADALCPVDHPIGSKRICVDIDYYETYNRDNVTLVNLRKNPIERITETGIQLADGHVDLDTLVLATGFDAMTGALLGIDIRGQGGQRLADKWAEGPRAYLGLIMAGFPNLFTITGPGSPSVLSNMLVSIEQHVDFIMDCLGHADELGAAKIETSVDVEDDWVSYVGEVADETLYGQGGSWYLGVNVAGKPRVFMPLATGVGPYREICDEIAADGYRGFKFAPAGKELAAD